MDGDLLDGFDKDGAAAAKLVDNVAVVHDFLAHVDRRAVRFQRKFNDIYRADDTGANRRGRTRSRVLVVAAV